MANDPANSQNNPTHRQTDGCDQNKQHVSPKDQVNILTAHVLFMGSVFVCCCYVAQSKARIDVSKSCVCFGPPSQT